MTWDVRREKNREGCREEGSKRGGEKRGGRGKEGGRSCDLIYNIPTSFQLTLSFVCGSQRAMWVFLSAL